MWSSMTMIILTIRFNLVKSTDNNGELQRSLVIKTSNNYMLIGYIFQTQQTTNVFGCAQCLVINRCKSFTYNTATRECYLNSNSTNGNEKSLLYAKGFIYGEKLPTKPNTPKSCSELKKNFPVTPSGNYVIDPDGQSGLAPFSVYCDMTDKGGVGVTVVSHDGEARTLVVNTASYIKDFAYNGVSVAQFTKLITISTHCEQFIKFECTGDVSFVGEGGAWWVSRDGVRQNYWGGATPGSKKCACGMTKTCQNKIKYCNCWNGDKDIGWRSDSGLLTDKSTLPVTQMRLGDFDNSHEQGYHTLGKLKCYGQT